MNDSAGVAIIGAGFISYFHAIAARETAGLRLAAIASRSASMAEHRGRIFDAEPYTFATLGEMLQRHDVDVAIVASPVHLHAEHALASAAAGKHLVIEKPLARTPGEARAIVAAARAGGVVAAYAENQVFTPLARCAREQIAAGAIGAVQSVRAVFKHGGPQRGTWFWQGSAAGGGVHLDLGSHALAVALYLTGGPEVRRVRSCQMRRDAGVEVEVTADAVMEAEGGVEITTESSWCEPKESCFYEVTGDRGVLRASFGPPPQLLTVRDADGVERYVDVPGQFEIRLDTFLAGLGYTGQLAHFADCFRSGARPSQSAEDGARLLEILAAGYLSAATKAPVNVADVPADIAPIDLLRS